MLTMNQVISEHCRMGEDDEAWLDLLVNEWAILADLAFADLILWVPDLEDDAFWACAQVRPTTGPTAVPSDILGERIAHDPGSLVTQAYLSGEPCHRAEHQLRTGIRVESQAIPIFNEGRRLAVLEMHTNRLGVRAPGALEDAYLEAAQLLAGMVSRHQFPLGGDRRVLWVSPRVGDGLIRVNPAGQITYASPNAVSAYRRLGWDGDLAGADFVAVTSSMFNERAPVERPLADTLTGRGSSELELETSSANVRLRILPLVDFAAPAGLLVLCRDTTELRSRERQLVTKDATIREIHHRVKNNLQTVVALLRLQARRIASAEASSALADAMKRISAIAVVHDILSQDFDQALRFDDVADRLLKMVGDVATTGGDVSMRREGSFGYVPTEVATSLSLVLTEVCQNAVEHGLKGGSGEVTVRPQQENGQLVVEVSNRGEQLPVDFRLAESTGLGLSIVRSVVADLGGDFELATTGEVTTARIRVPLA